MEIPGGLGVLTSALRAQGVWIFSGTINKWDKINHEVTIMIEFLLNIMTIRAETVAIAGKPIQPELTFSSWNLENWGD